MLLHNKTQDKTCTMCSVTAEMIHTWNITIPELTGNEPRKVYLYLPESYSYETDRHYPVLYMFDGHNLFFDTDATYGKSWGMKEYMDYTNTPMIIAAVECNHSPDNGRLKEYSPFTFYDPLFGTITGLGHTTMKWLIHTFKAEIDRNFRTISDRKHTFIGGSSMGGLMSLYAVLEYNCTFSKAAALSPSLWTAPDKISNMIHLSSLHPETVIYMDYGSKELHSRNMNRLFQKTVSQLLKKNIWLTSRIVPDGSHCEASWEKQIPFFIPALLYQ